MHDVWTISETLNGKLKQISFELLARGRKLADDLGVALCSIVIGDGISDEEAQTLAHYGADVVYLANDSGLASFECTRYANVLLSLIETHKPEVILAGATSSGRTLMPYVGIKAHAGLTADCTELAIDGKTKNLLQTRPAIGGNIMATIITPNHRPQMATVRPRSTKILEPDYGRKAVIQYVKYPDKASVSTISVTGIRPFEGQQSSIDEAEIIVSGGKGLKKKDNVGLIEELAAVLGGEVGATRDAVDRGWISYPHQVGLSGKTVSPKLYLAVGISGAIQHLAGIKTSECIVAINNDEQANILGLADFAIIGDLFDVVPELTRQLEKRNNA